MSSWGGDWNRDGGGRRDDRGGGYGGGGGGGSRECYKCGKDGHFARECPDSEGGGRGGGGGGGGGGGRACYKCDEEGHIARDCPQGGGYSRGGGGGGGGGFSREGRYEGGAARRDEGGLITMMVPNRDLGRIIGKGGCKIRELQDNSSARINIRKDDSDGRETPVDLIGSPDSTSMVKGMIDEVLQSNPRGYGYS